MYRTSLAYLRSTILHPVLHTNAQLGRPAFLLTPPASTTKGTFDSSLRDGFDLANGGDQDELEDEKGKKSGSNDGQEELLHARQNFGSRAWLLENLV